MEAFERVARAAVADASALLRSTWREAKTIHHKGAVDIVTETDHAVEALVIGHLQRAFPDHTIVAEESSAGKSLVRPAADAHVWYLDPLDGTTNFATAYPHFAVSLALGRGPDMMFGIVHDPIRDETFIAEHGRGARLNDQPIGVSTTDTLD